LEIEKWKVSKFSSALSKNCKLSKPEMWNRLADYYDFDDLPSNIKNVLDYINWL
jgi:hypothetical protein